MSTVVVESLLTCPHCGFDAVETMPIDACQFFYECRGCGLLLRPKAGDCCVFCSFGTVKCPPIQTLSGCCGSPTVDANVKPTRVTPSSDEANA